MQERDRERSMFFVYGYERKCYQHAGRKNSPHKSLSFYIFMLEKKGNTRRGNTDINPVCALFCTKKRERDRKRRKHAENTKGVKWERKIFLYLSILTLSHASTRPLWCNESREHMQLVDRMCRGLRRVAYLGYERVDFKKLRVTLVFLTAATR